VCHKDPPPHHDIVALDPEHATGLLRLLRELEGLLDDCDEPITDAVDEYFGFEPAAETYAAAIALEAERLQQAIDDYRYPHEAHAG
jgi:hypothetical protein